MNPSTLPTVFLLVILSATFDLVIIRISTSQLGKVVPAASTATTATTTKLVHLQIAFRHGDRAPRAPLPPNDPYAANVPKYWPYGLGRLTDRGYARAFRLGQWLRAKYGHFLGDSFDQSVVHLQSTAVDRCLDSVRLVIAGAYPPNSSYTQLNIPRLRSILSTAIQPVTIECFLPTMEDSLLFTMRHCPKAETEADAQMNSPRMRQLLRENKDLLVEVSRVSGAKIDSITRAYSLFSKMMVEHQCGYYWSDRMDPSPWTREQEVDVVERLRVLAEARWNSAWNSTTLKRTRAGEFLNLIGDNFRGKRDQILEQKNRLFQNPKEEEARNRLKKLVIFGTHDTKLSAVLTALDLWNGILVSYSSTIIFELHQSIDPNSNFISKNAAQFFVAFKYFNETMSLLDGNLLMPSKGKLADAYSLQLPQCGSQAVRSPDGATHLCPLDRFLDIVEQFRVYDWDAECAFDESDKSKLLKNKFL